MIASLDIIRNPKQCLCRVEVVSIGRFGAIKREFALHSLENLEWKGATPASLLAITSKGVEKAVVEGIELLLG